MGGRVGMGGGEPVTQAFGEPRSQPAPTFWAVVWDWTKTLVLCLVVALLLRQFVAQSYTVDGACMQPTLATGQRVFILKPAYLFSSPQRGDIIVFQYPLDPSKDYIKRVVALPGETVAICGGFVYIDGQRLDESLWPVTRDEVRYGDLAERVVPAEHFFVLGDNRPQSEDSRVWGFVPAENVRGKAFLLYWPPWKLKWIG